MLTPELASAFIEMMAGGCYIETACDALHINQGTWQKWARIAGQYAHVPDDEIPFEVVETDRKYVLFHREVLAAQANAERELVKLVKDAARDDWRAGTELLKMRHRDRYAKNSANNPGIDIELVASLIDKLIDKFVPDGIRDEAAAFLSDELSRIDVA